MQEIHVLANSVMQLKMAHVTTITRKSSEMCNRTFSLMHINGGFYQKKFLQVLKNVMLNLINKAELTYFCTSWTMGLVFMKN